MVHFILEDELRQDSYLTNLLNRIEAKEDGLQGYSVVNGVILFNRRVVIPWEYLWVGKLFQEYHGGPVRGYEGTQKTYQRLASEFYWVGMKAYVVKRVAKCDVCQRNKSSNLAPAGLLQHLNLLERIWEDTTMDFVEGLPRLEGFSVLFMVVDRLSKSALFIPLKHSFITASMVGAFIQELFACMLGDLFALFYFSTAEGVVTFEVDLYLVERDELVAELKGSLLRAQQLMKQRADGHRRDVVKGALGDGVAVSTLPTGVADSDEGLVFAPVAVLDVRGKEGRREMLIA
nr:hypothetical protein [Tanacetum cinerariifolium]